MFSREKKYGYREQHETGKRVKRVESASSLKALIFHILGIWHGKKEGYRERGKREGLKGLSKAEWVSCFYPLVAMYLNRARIHFPPPISYICGPSLCISKGRPRDRRPLFHPRSHFPPRSATRDDDPNTNECIVWMEGKEARGRGITKK